MEFRDACRMDSIEQLGLVLAESICGAPIVGKDDVHRGIQALPESPKHSYNMNAAAVAEVFDFNSVQGSSQLQVLLQVKTTKELFVALRTETLFKRVYFALILQFWSSVVSGSGSPQIQWSILEARRIYAPGPVFSNRPSHSSQGQQERFLRGEWIIWVLFILCPSARPCILNNEVFGLPSPRTNDQS